MSGENYTNTAAISTLASPAGPSDLTFTVASYTGFPAAPYWGMFEKGAASVELVRVTNVAGSVLTITRGQGGTAATSHGAGVTFEHVVPASHFNETEAHIAATTAHGVTGVVVGTTGAQTVSDKLFRGGFKAQNTDALPVGLVASFESMADDASGQDGFVHRSTAGHVDRKGFLLQQSGTDRVSVFNDGTVDLAPAASARPGFRNHSTTTLDGATTHNASVTVTAGGINVAGGVVASGGAIITGSTALDGTSVQSLTSAGAVSGTNGSFSGTLGATGTATLAGAATVGTTLGVGGAATAASLATTGAVTAQAGKVASFQSGTDYGMQSEIVVTNGTRTRPTRQPLVTQVRKISIAATIGSTTASSIATFSYTPRTAGHLCAHLSAHFQAASDGASGGPFEPLESSFNFRLRNAGNTTTHDQSDLYTVTVTASDGFSYRGWTVIPINFTSSFEMVAGTAYTLEIFGARSASSALSQILQHITGDLQEVAVIASIT